MLSKNAQKHFQRLAPYNNLVTQSFYILIATVCPIKSLLYKLCYVERSTFFEGSCPVFYIVLLNRLKLPLVTK